MDKEEDEYLLYGGDKALELFGISKEALIETECEDFMVYRKLGDAHMRYLEKDHPMGWTGPLTIDRKTYRVLHHNLCLKYRRKFQKC